MLWLDFAIYGIFSWDSCISQIPWVYTSSILKKFLLVCFYFRVILAVYILFTWVGPFFFPINFYLPKKKKIIIMPIEVWFLCFFLHEFTKLLLHIHSFFFFLLLEVYWLMIICGSCVLYTYIGLLVSLIICNKMQARVEKLLWKSKMKFNLVQSHWKQKQPKLKGVPCRKPRELQKLLEKVQELILCICVIPWMTIIYYFHYLLVLSTFFPHLNKFFTFYLFP